MGRTVSAVVTWGDTYLGVIGPFPVSVPWWAEVEPVVAHLRAVLDVPVLVLRLLTVEGGEGARDGHVTYHVAALDRPAPGLLAGRPPIDHGVLNGPEELRSPWARLEGLNEVLTWASDTLAAAGRPMTGAAEQQRTWNLSALFRLPTGPGPVWLKATPRFATDEASVVAAFARVDPTLVPPVIGAGPRRVLLEHLPGEDCWDASTQIITGAVERMAATQAVLAGQAVRETGQAAGLPPGLPDRRTPVIAGQIAALLDGEVGGQLDAGEVAAARALLSRFRLLDECRLPDTIVHGDFHPGNWRSDGGPPVVVDWADAHLGNPVLDGLRARDFLPAGKRPVAARAWIDAWAARVPGCEPARALAIAEPLAHLSYAVRYQEFLDGIEPSERVYHLGDPAAAIRAALRSALAEEVQQQGVDLVRGVQLQPVTRAVQAIPGLRHHGTMQESGPGAGAVTLCVLLWARPGAEAGLIAYEDQVLGIASGYGGRVLQRARSSGADGQPLEVQLLEFPSARAVEEFMADGRRQSLAGERERVIARTEVIDVRLVRPDPGP